MNIFSPMVTGNGAWIIHKLLSEKIEHYYLQDINPYHALFAPALTTCKPRMNPFEVYHSAPDLGTALMSNESKNVITFHNFYFDSFVRKNSTLFQSLYYSTLLKYSVTNACIKANDIICVSDFIADLVLKYYPKHKNKISVIKNGIDTDLFKPKNDLNDEYIRVLFAGNPTQRKGIDVLLKLADVLPENCILQCTSGARNISLAKHPKIQFLGKVSYEQMPTVYQNADILFFPTLREGLSLVTIEAMSCGLPVISTVATSQEELIDHDKGGYLCNIGDVSQMLKYINTLSTNQALRMEMGAYNREKAVKLFNNKRMINEYKTIFSST